MDNFPDQGAFPTHPPSLDIGCTREGKWTASLSGGRKMIRKGGGYWAILQMAIARVFPDISQHIPTFPDSRGRLESVGIPTFPDSRGMSGSVRVAPRGGPP